MLLLYGTEDYVVRISFIRASGVTDIQYLFSALRIGIALLLIQMIVVVPHRIYSCFSVILLRTKEIKKEGKKEIRKEKHKEKRKNKGNE
jgi:hypothetical protein